MRILIHNCKMIQQVSKNRYRGAPIRSLREIADLVKERRAIVFTTSFNISIKPAAWIINQNGAWLNSMIEHEQLHYCVKYEEI